MKQLLKRYKLSVIAQLFLLSIGLVACTNKFDEINTPENLLSEDKINSATVGQAFGYAQYYGLGAGTEQVQENLHAHIYVQYFTSNVASFSTERFVPNGTWVDIFWKDFYAKSALMQFTTEKVTKDNNMTLANAIAKVWRVELYHRMTDYFGPIVYSQFGNQQTSVAYDSQKDIYYDFFKTLDEAVLVFKQNPTGNGFGAYDQIYGGSVSQWLKFANSLRLRLAVRLAYADQNKAKAEAEKAIVDGVILTNEDNAGVKSTANNTNVLSHITYLTNDFRASSGLISALKGYNDPRLSIYYAPAANGSQYVGLRNGFAVSDRGPTLSPVTSYVGSQWVGNPPRAGTQNPTMVFTAAEVAFLRAEGALRTWNMGGTPQSLYNDGIRLSLTQNIPGIVSAQVTAYQNTVSTPAALVDKWNSPAMSNIPVLYDAAGSFEKQLEQIITQKWIAVYPDGYEAWAERRRTGYPRGYALIGSDNPDLSTTDLARRVIYAPSEVTTNKDGYNGALGLLSGADNMKTRLWWDQKPLSAYPIPSN
jgi:hypothetical protein